MNTGKIYVYGQVEGAICFFAIISYGARRFFYKNVCSPSATSYNKFCTAPKRRNVQGMLDKTDPLILRFCIDSSPMLLIMKSLEQCSIVRTLSTRLSTSYEKDT